MKVTVIDKQSGKPRLMGERFAKILTGLGRATYLTRDMRAAEPAAPVVDEGDLEMDAPEKRQKAESAPRRARKARADK